MTNRDPGEWAANRDPRDRLAGLSSVRRPSSSCPTRFRRRRQFKSAREAEEEHGEGERKAPSTATKETRKPSSRGSRQKGFSTVSRAYVNPLTFGRIAAALRS